MLGAEHTQPECIETTLNGTETHGCRDYRAERPAPSCVKYARRNGDANDIIEESPEKVLADSAHDGPAQLDGRNGIQKVVFSLSTMSADSIATSVPAPMAIPTSARARAWASLMPSPIIATFLPCSCKERIYAPCPGGVLLTTLLIPA